MSIQESEEVIISIGESVVRSVEIVVVFYRSLSSMQSNFHTKITYHYTIYSWSVNKWNNNELAIIILLRYYAHYNYVTIGIIYYAYYAN